MRFPFGRVLLLNIYMDIKDIRHHHFMVAWNEYGENRAMSEAICAKLEEEGISGPITPGYISQMKNRTRDIGHSTARKLEVGLGKPIMSFDNIDAGLLKQQIVDGVLSFTDEERRELALALLEKSRGKPP